MHKLDSAVWKNISKFVAAIAILVTASTSLSGQRFDEEGIKASPTSTEPLLIDLSSKDLKEYRESKVSSSEENDAYLRTVLPYNKSKRRR